MLISSHPFAAARPTEDSLRYVMDVTEPICARGADRYFLMGGVGFGACIDALEHATGLPLIFASAQFLSFATVGETVDLAVELPAQGRTMTQGRVVASVGDRDVLRVTAALGGRDAELDRSWGVMPDVPAPLDCPLRPDEHDGIVTIHSAIEDRTVPSPDASATGVSRPAPIRSTEPRRSKSNKARPERRIRRAELGRGEFGRPGAAKIPT